VVNQAESELERQFRDLRDRFNQLEKNFRQHIGTQTGASTVNSPHPNLHAADGEYTLTNVTTDRVFDADTVVVAELADIVGTIINDLIDVGILRS